MVHQLGDKRFVVCVSVAVLEFSDRWDAECCLKSLQVSSVYLGSDLYIRWAKIKHFWLRFGIAALFAN